MRNTIDSNDLITVTNLKKYYPLRGGLLRRVQAWIRAVDDVSFAVKEGETVGLVGESGCGKSTVGRTILGLESPTGGEVYFGKTNLFELDSEKMKSFRKKMQIIFQDPHASLDPRMMIKDCISEGLKIHRLGTPAERSDMVMKYLLRVGLSEEHAKRFPHEFSGGQQQRIGIARALVLEPEFIICDEPVSALDVSIQAQVLNLLKDLKKEFNLSYLFIAHDLSVVEHISDRVIVMYLGKIVEMTTREQLFLNPKHPYTQALMSSIPLHVPGKKRDRIVLQGDIPSALNPPSGCYFHPRCPKAMDQCKRAEPPSVMVDNDHTVSCWLCV
jgi:peptide/nickel transport system ATP-binding protein/oligopeptide transport system ATP-binding protein